MGDEIRVLRFVWRNKEVDIKVEVDKCNLMDIVIDYEDEAKKKGLKLDYHYPVFAYVYNKDHHKLLTDKDLLLMFERLTGNVITIWVGTCLKPDQLYKLVLNFRRMNEKTSGMVHESLPCLDDLEDTFVPSADKPSQSKTKKVSTTKKPKQIPKSRPKAAATNLPPPPVSPKTAFERLPIRRSPRFSPSLTEKATMNPTPSLPEQSLFQRKIPKTTARSKGLSTSHKVSTDTELQGTGTAQQAEECSRGEECEKKGEV